jgi:hypothetical protein
VRKLAVCLVACSALAACTRGAPPNEEPPSNAETPVGIPPLQTRLRVPLPAPNGKPPLKTEGVFDQAKMDAIGEPSFEGWEKIPHGGLKGHVQVRHQTKDHPKVMVEITLDPCGDKHPCTTMDLAKWKDEIKQQEVKTTLLGSALAAAPDTVWELGQTMANSVPVIYMFGLGQAFSNGGDYADMFALFYNDGANEMRVVASYVDDPVQNKEMMVKLVNRETLEKVARAFFDAYGQIW